jgi:hypothetical protein
MLRIIDNTVSVRVGYKFFVKSICMFLVFMFLNHINMFRVLGLKSYLGGIPTIHMGFG